MSRIDKGFTFIGLAVFTAFYNFVEMASTVHVAATFPDYPLILLKYGGYSISVLMFVVGFYLVATTPRQG